jgi:O-antigen ligase
MGCEKLADWAAPVRLRLPPAERMAYGFFLITLAFSQISIAGTHIAFGFCVFFFLLHVWSNRPQLASSGIEIPYGMLILILALSSLLSAQPATSLFNLRKFGLIVFLYLNLWLVNTRRRLIWSHVVLALALAGMSVFEITRSTLEDMRLRWATHGITVTYGVVIMMSLLILLAVRSSLRSALRSVDWPELFLEKYYLALIIIVIAVAFFLAGVRSAFIGFLFGFFVLAVLKEPRLLIYFLAILFLAILIAPPEWQARIADIFNVTGDLSVRGRVLLWQTGWNIFMAKPWLGWGWVDLAALYPEYAPPGVDLTKHPFHIGHVHNNFLQMAIVGGIIGLAAFVWLWGTMGWKLYAAWRRVQDSYCRDTVLGTLSAFVAYLFASVFDWSFGDEEITIALWLLCGLGFAAARLNEEAAGHKIFVQ